MKLVRRALGAIALTVLAAAALRLRGHGGTPPQHGGWRLLDAPGVDQADTAAASSAP